MDLKSIKPLSEQDKQDAIEKIYKIMDKGLAYFNEIKHKSECKLRLITLGRVFYHESGMKEIFLEFLKPNTENKQRENEGKFHNWFKKQEQKLTEQYGNSYHILKKYLIVDDGKKINAMTIGIPYSENREEKFFGTMIIREDQRPNMYKEFENTFNLYIN